MAGVTYRKHEDGLVILGDAFSSDVDELIVSEFGVGKQHVPEFKLSICDPGYGAITKEAWDVAHYDGWMRLCNDVAALDAVICMWGGVGKKGHRPFLSFAASVEKEFDGWEIKNWVTWGKKRAYGVRDNYLFTREECLILTRGRPTFNIPLLAKERGYEGYSKKYPAKSAFLRRTNVWTDVTEILRGKIHPTQKPDRLYEVLIESHSSPGDAVFDPCAGSCPTVRAARKLGRRFCVVERDADYLKKADLWP
jgi:DNA modification methylase